MKWTMNQATKLMTADDHRDGEDVMPGFRVPVAQIFG
jgi:hypothetical protein